MDFLDYTLIYSWFYSFFLGSLIIFVGSFLTTFLYKKGTEPPKWLAISFFFYMLLTVMNVHNLNPVECEINDWSKKEGYRLLSIGLNSISLYGPKNFLNKKNKIWEL